MTRAPSADLLVGFKAASGGMYEWRSVAFVQWRRVVPVALRSAYRLSSRPRFVEEAPLQLRSFTQPHPRVVRRSGGASPAKPDQSVAYPNKVPVTPAPVSPASSSPALSSFSCAAEGQPSPTAYRTGQPAKGTKAKEFLGRIVSGGNGRNKSSEYPAFVMRQLRLSALRTPAFVSGQQSPRATGPKEVLARAFQNQRQIAKSNAFQSMRRRFAGPPDKLQ